MTREHWAKGHRGFVRDESNGRHWFVFDASGHGGTYRPRSTRKWAAYCDGTALRDSRGRVRTFGTSEAAMVAAEKLMQTETDTALAVMGKACQED